MKKNLERDARGLIVVAMVIGFVMAYMGVAHAQVEQPTNVMIDAAGVVLYSIPLSPTIAIVDASEGLNIRKGPSQTYMERSGLLPGAQVIIKGKNSPDCSWVYITKITNTFGGWVFSAYLRNSQGILISEECPPTREPLVTSGIPATPAASQNESPDRKDNSFLERYKMLVIGIAALFLTAIIYWIAYTKGIFSRLRQRESSAETSVNSKIPKAGTPYLEGMQTSAQPIYCPLDRKTISIGRNQENTLVIDSRFVQWDTVSSRHARIEQDGDSFIIADLDSKNGVFVDGRRTQENILYDGMQVSLGKVAFFFRVNEK